MKRPFTIGLVAPAVLAEVGILARHSLGLTPCGIGDFILCATVLPLSLSQGGKFIVAFAVLKLLFALSLYGLMFAILRRIEEGRATYASIAASIAVTGMSFGTFALK
jgi:hypothetical protein